MGRSEKNGRFSLLPMRQDLSETPVSMQPTLRVYLSTSIFFQDRGGGITLKAIKKAEHFVAWNYFVAKSLAWTADDGASVIA